MYYISWNHSLCAFWSRIEILEKGEMRNIKLLINNKFTQVSLKKRINLVLSSNFIISNVLLIVLKILHIALLHNLIH